MFSWLETLADVVTYSWLGIEREAALGHAVSFFLYDSIKILILLVLIVTLMGVVNAYLPIERLRAALQRHRLYGLEHLLAAVFGAITPFCSCSSVPLFIGFVQGGIPLGVTFSFLITSPLVNEVAIALFIGVFGWKATLIYAGSGILLGTLGGWLLGRFRLEPLLTDWVQDIIQRRVGSAAAHTDHRTFRERLPEILLGSWEIVRGVLIYIIIGIGIGAAMHGYVPASFFERSLGGGQWWTVPVAVVVAVPMYANAAAIVPIVQVFVSKGVALGTAIAFMMATVGLSIPEATMLKKVMSLRLIAVFFGMVTLFIMLSGFLFNLIL